MAKRAAIGIDLGTTYTCAGVYSGGKVEIVQNKEGNKTTPSVVAFTKVDRLFGNSAKDHFYLYPENTVYDAKRMIGKKFYDPVVQADSRVWPFNIVEMNGKLKIEVTYKDETRTFLPEQISSMILTKMKESCEAFLGYKVTDAVITVPAYFNDSQRQATKDAGTIAGLTVLRIINEPTAAAIAFGFEEKLNVEKKVLIYDLGGGTFDISILSIEKGVFNVIAVAGDTHLGGQDFDQRMAKYLADEFQKKHKRNCWTNKKSVIKLLTNSEKAKRSLSLWKEVPIFIESFFEDIDFQMIMTQDRFNELNAELFDATIEQVKKALKDAKLNKSDIDEIVLVGGSTRIPRIRELLGKFFNGKVLNENIDADEAVAIGAAIQASILNGDQDRQTQNIQLHDVIPKSLGIKTVGVNDMSFLVRKNTRIPIKKRKTYCTSCDFQTEAIFAVFEGENPCTLDNHWLGEFTIVEIESRKEGEEKFDVTFDIDANGILNVTAVNSSSGKKNSVIINKKRLDEEGMKLVLEQTEKFRIEDEENDKVIQAKNSLESLCNIILIAVEEFKNQIHQTEKKPILEKCVEILEWIDENPKAAIDEYVSRDVELKKLSEQIFHTNASALFGYEDIPE